MQLRFDQEKLSIAAKDPASRLGTVEELPEAIVVRGARTFGSPIDSRLGCSLDRCGGCGSGAHDTSEGLRSTVTAEDYHELVMDITQSTLVEKRRYRTARNLKPLYEHRW